MSSKFESSASFVNVFDVLASLDHQKYFNIALDDKQSSCPNLGDSDAARFSGAGYVFSLSPVLQLCFIQ